MRIRHKLWLEDEAGVLFGEGRQELLKAVAELGSLSAAAKRLDMGYRAAWGRIRASESRLGIKLLKPAASGRGLVLTPEGQKLLERFSLFEAEVSKAIETIGRRIFGQDPNFGLGQDETEKD